MDIEITNKLYEESQRATLKTKKEIKELKKKNKISSVIEKYSWLDGYLAGIKVASKLIDKSIKEEVENL